MSHSLFADLAQFSKKKLQPTETRVRLRDGTTLVEKNGSVTGADHTVELSLFIDFRAETDVLTNLFQGTVEMRLSPLQTVAEVSKLLQPRFEKN